ALGLLQLRRLQVGIPLSGTPRPPEYERRVGPDEFHLLIKDNGPVKRALLLFFVLFGIASAAPVAIVVSNDVPVDDLSFAEVRTVFLGGRQFWNLKLRVVLLMRAPVAPERDVVLRTIYQMSEAQFRQYWISKVFRAEATSGPKIVYSNEMATELVNAIPGSVAFVEASQVPKGLKILKIDGKLPGEKGYPWRWRMNRMRNRFLLPIFLSTPFLAAQQNAPAPSDDHALIQQLLQRVKDLEEEVKRLKGQPPATPTETAAVPAQQTAPPAATPPADMPGMREPSVAGLPGIQLRGFSDLRFVSSNSQAGKPASFGMGQFNLFITSKLSDKFSVLG